MNRELGRGRGGASLTEPSHDEEMILDEQIRYYRARANEYDATSTPPGDAFAAHEELVRAGLRRSGGAGLPSRRFDTGPGFGEGRVPPIFGGMMLKVTPKAATALADARGEAGAPDTHGVRFFADQQEGQAPRLAIGFAAEPGPKDTVTEQEGIKTFLAPEVVDVLTDVTLDARPANGQQELVLLRGDEAGDDKAKA